jgi:hypothetical protein
MGRITGVDDPPHRRHRGRHAVPINRPHRGGTGSDGSAYRHLFAEATESWPDLEEWALLRWRWPRHPLALAHVAARALQSADALARGVFSGRAARALFAGSRRTVCGHLRPDRLRPLVSDSCWPAMLVGGPCQAAVRRNWRTPWRRTCGH